MIHVFQGVGQTVDQQSASFRILEGPCPEKYTTGQWILVRWVSGNVFSVVLFLPHPRLDIKWHQNSVKP